MNKALTQPFRRLFVADSSVWIRHHGSPRTSSVAASQYATNGPGKSCTAKPRPVPSHKTWSRPASTATVTDEEVAKLNKQSQHSLSLADLVRHGRPPLSTTALFASANFTLALLPIRLAHRIQALRNLPFIVVSNPNINKIYKNYMHSLSTLLPWQNHTISSVEAETVFTSVLAELVQTHQDTIPILAKGFLECREYISPDEVTRFLDEHLKARIGTRLIAEQHIALHYSSAAHFDPAGSPTPCPEQANFIGVIDTALSPFEIVDSCAGFVAEICELRYGLRPKWVVDGEPDTMFAYIPMHLEYIVTELLKNAFRATVESRRTSEPVAITIAPEQNSAAEPSSSSSPAIKLEPAAESRGAFRSEAIKPLDDNAPGVTIRIRDRGGGIAPEVLPHVWRFSYTTFTDDEDDDFSAGKDGLSMIGHVNGGGSTIAGLGYGLPLSRAYAEYFGGGITVQSLHGWGTDVYLRLKGVGNIR